MNEEHNQYIGSLGSYPEKIETTTSASPAGEQEAELAAFRQEIAEELGWSKHDPNLNFSVKEHGRQINPDELEALDLEMWQLLKAGRLASFVVPGQDKTGFEKFKNYESAVLKIAKDSPSREAFLGLLRTKLQVQESEQELREMEERIKTQQIGRGS